jgi:hypothetical protein
VNCRVDSDADDGFDHSGRLRRSAWALSKLVRDDSRHDTLHHAVHGPALVPVPDKDDIVLGVEPDGVGPVAYSRKARSRRAGPLLFLGI